MVQSLNFKRVNVLIRNFSIGFTHRPANAPENIWNREIVLFQCYWCMDVVGCYRPFMFLGIITICLNFINLLAKFDYFAIIVLKGCSRLGLRTQDVKVNEKEWLNYTKNPKFYIFSWDHANGSNSKIFEYCCIHR